MITRTVCGLVVASVIAVSSSALVEQPALTSWVGQQPSQIDAVARLCANHSRVAWDVSQDRGALAIKRVDPYSVPRTSPDLLDRARAIPDISIRHAQERVRSVPFRGGWLVGLDQGEFGGGLWWLSRNLANYRRLTTEPVVGLVSWGERVLVLAGLEHLDIKRGGVFEASTDDAGMAHLRMLADLGAEPRAVYAGRGSLVVATAVGVARVSANGMVAWLSRRDYSLPGPRSVAVLDSGAVYVGMSRWVVELLPATSGYQETWYVPGDCVGFYLDKTRLECECRAR